MNIRPYNIMSRFILVLGLIGLLGTAACEPPNPNANSPTSGRLVVFVDEPYAPLFTALADSFMAVQPNAHIEVRAVNARAAVQGLIDTYLSDTLRTDTSVTSAAILGRYLLPDERQAITSGGLELKEYLIGYDGFAAVVPSSSSLQSTTVERLRAALASTAPSVSMLDSTAPNTPLSFVLTDQNSSAFGFLRSKLLNDSDATVPARYFSTVDSVLAALSRGGESIGFTGWYPAHRDSATVRTLSLGYTDSTGTVHPPVRVHPASLVTDVYPLKLPLVGYTFSSVNTLAVGFLATVAKGAESQRYLVNSGLQGENIRMRLVLPEEP